MGAGTEMLGAAGRLKGFLRHRTKGLTAWDSGLLRRFDYLEKSLRNLFMPVYPLRCSLVLPFSIE